MIVNKYCAQGVQSIYTNVLICQLNATQCSHPISFYAYSVNNAGRTWTTYVHRYIHIAAYLILAWKREYFF